MDDDEDEIMLSATHQSQFTQSLMLFVRLPRLLILPFPFSLKKINSLKHNPEIVIHLILHGSMPP